ncbi:hypothetical protein EDD37DRAFT_138697 [Exophiala viscosa]|uniref:Uncharacterized protein n=1 Tax=Exophiala viscosa TaxID=2486360 RepID=A0AAN6I9E8_9EURO|nr:hypothetical protein EDD36DRAFT_422805 [Exophiala viscosa]KAI1620940.1 hypothetical protein EDD37DRAFT_138697 [Exophiala viscosa]
MEHQRAQATQAGWPGYKSIEEDLKAAMWTEASVDSENTAGDDSVQVPDRSDPLSSDDDLQIVATRTRSLSPMSEDFDTPPQQPRARVYPDRDPVFQIWSSPPLRHASQRSARPFPNDQEAQASRSVSNTSFRGSRLAPDDPREKRSEDVALARALKASRRSYAAEQSVGQEKTRRFVSDNAGDRREKEELEWALRMSSLEYEAQHGAQRVSEQPERRPANFATTDSETTPHGAKTWAESSRRPIPSYEKASMPRKRAEVSGFSTSEDNGIRGRVQDALQQVRLAAERVQMKSPDIARPTEDDQLTAIFARDITNGNFEKAVTNFCQQAGGAVQPIFRATALGETTRSAREFTGRLLTPPPSQSNLAAESDDQPLPVQIRRLRAENTKLKHQIDSLRDEKAMDTRRIARLTSRRDELAKDLKIYDGLLFTTG